MRFTLLYVGMFLASTACLLTITYFLIEQTLPHPVTTSNGAIELIGGSGQLSTGGASPTPARSRSSRPRSGCAPTR
jgi:hypothetical protein